MNARKERQIARQLKATALRKIADEPWSYNDLLSVFGLAIRAKLSATTNPHNRIGKHYFGSHDNRSPHSHHSVQHPAGTKLVRSFIRRSGRESIPWRNLYKELTGKHYHAADASP